MSLREMLYSCDTQMDLSQIVPERRCEYEKLELLKASVTRC